MRDELAGWFTGMTTYNDAGRAFWIEAYGGRPYRVERQKHPDPIVIPHLAVAVTGGTQPDKLAELMREADDGLLARCCWFWPNPVPFKLGTYPPGTSWATDALDWLRCLAMWPGDPPDALPEPVRVPLAADARADLEAFGQDMQTRQGDAAGLMRSALGKARGTALRLALVLEHLRWCGERANASPPVSISREAFLAAACMVADYLMPMAERVYGDAAAPASERDAATLARWIARAKPGEVHVRAVQREARLPGLRDAASIHAAAEGLIEAGWLLAPVSLGVGGRPKAAYAVNARLWAILP